MTQPTDPVDPLHPTAAPETVPPSVPARSVAGPRRPAWGRAALPALGALLLVVLAIGGAGARAGAEPAATFAAGTPEAAFTAYVTDWTLGRAEDAWARLTPWAQQRVGWPAFQDASAGPDGDRAVRVAIAATVQEGSRVRLIVHIVRASGDPFGGGWERSTLGVVLVQVDGAWRIDTPLYGLMVW